MDKRRSHLIKASNCDKAMSSRVSRVVRVGWVKLPDALKLVSLGGQVPYTILESSGQHGRWTSKTNRMSD